MSLADLFNIVLYQPIFNLLVLLYVFLPGQDLGVAIIVLTFLVRLLLSPISRQGVLSQRKLAELQPKIKSLQEKFKNNKEEQGRAVMKLYKEAGVNPLSGCLPMLLQLPFLIAIYRVFWQGLHPEQFNLLYSFVPRPENIEPTFLGLVDLNSPAAFLAFLAGAVQYWQAKKTMPPNQPGQKKEKLDIQSIMQKQMLYFFPFFTIIILLRFPSALALYWLVSSLFSIVEHHLTHIKHAKGST